MTTGSNKENNRILIFSSLIFAGEAIFFLPFVLARIFRPTLLKVFEITNLELGTYFSVYGIVAMISYFFGGMLADKYPARNLMTTALLTTALGGLIMTFIPSGNVLMLLYGYWGFTTIFLFWAALIRATREWGGNDFQGRAFGFLEGGRGLVAALLATIALALFSWFSGSDGAELSIKEGRNNSFQYVVLVTSVITFLAGLIVWKMIPQKSASKQKEHERFSFVQLNILIKKPAIWLQAIIIVCGYVGYKITDDFSLYANEVLGFDEIGAAGIGTMALWLRPVIAIAAGLLADRWEGTKVITVGFLAMMIGGGLIFSGLFTHVMVWIFLVLITTMIGVYGIRGIYFAIMQESKVPLAATGTAVGIMSVVGFTPDVFMSPFMGYLLDTYPGATGHQYVFLVLSIAAVVGLLASLRLRKHTSN